MGAAVSAFRNAITAPDKEAKARLLEQLAFLVKSANSELDKYQGELEDMFQDPESVQKKMIPGLRAMRWERGYRVNVDSKTSEGGLSEVVDSFFGLVQDGVTPADKDTKNKAIINGFKVRSTPNAGALNAILGNNHAGEQEEQKFFIFMEHNAIIRIDVKIWRYNFSGKGVMADAENVFCYIFCTSVVDSAKLQRDELVYLLSEYAGDDDVNAYVDQLLQVWTSINKMHSFIQTRAFELAAANSHTLALLSPPKKYEEEGEGQVEGTKSLLMSPETKEYH
ncbi:hypothetical protein EST38_g5380 [Candolleomyces aberdarensis]|uniref:Uncharacterized protein n=1 Tax=Candolleomyces aberdarensis TaxID=2316362 RepID=A0A4Q2DKJ9_9AGAR|nr:hypothetical protein EST38_g5380 [Candolleomyces aberdarensis]